MCLCSGRAPQHIRPSSRQDRHSQSTLSTSSSGCAWVEDAAPEWGWSCDSDAGALVQGCRFAVSIEEVHGKSAWLRFWHRNGQLLRLLWSPAPREMMGISPGRPAAIDDGICTP